MNENDRNSEEVDIDPFEDAPDQSLRQSAIEKQDDGDDEAIDFSEGEQLGGNPLDPRPLGGEAAPVAPDTIQDTL